MDSLLKGRLYCVSFFISQADNCQYATDAIGTYFSYELITNTTSTYIPVLPQVHNADGNVVYDTLSWTQISGHFWAEGGEKYMTIGNFNTDQNTQKAFVTPAAMNVGAGYYIDDVSVVLCDTLDEERELYVPTAFSPNGDGENELLFVRGGNIKSLRFTVYDRWGEQVFETLEQSRGWDGMYGGHALPGGVYGWLLEAELHTGERITRSGTVLLRR